MPVQALLYYIRHTLSSIKLIIKRKLNELEPPGTENGRGMGCCISGASILKKESQLKTPFRGCTL